MWAGGGWEDLQLAGHRGPESVLTEMFAQLKKNTYCVTSQRGVSNRVRVRVRAYSVSRNTSTLLLLASEHLHWSIWGLGAIAHT